NARGDLHQVGDPELHRRDRARVEPAAEADYRLVLAVAGDVDAHDERRRRILLQRARHGPADALAVHELHRAGARGDAPYAHEHEVGIPRRSPSPRWRSGSCWSWRPVANRSGAATSDG